jgi:hypothetical protein
MKMSAHEWQNLLEQIGNNLYLKEFLIFNNQGFTDQDIPDLLSALEKNTSIKDLYIFGSQIGDAGAEALAANQSLSDLSLISNQIGDKGAIALAANQTLSYLNLKGNQIGDAGAKALAANQSLSYLNLQWNDISDAGARALAANQTLTSLNLKGNQISEAGAIALAANQSLSSLNIAHNEWNEIGNAGAIQRLAANQTALNSRRISSENRFEFLRFLYKNHQHPLLECGVFPQIFDMAGVPLSERAPTQAELRAQQEEVRRIKSKHCCIL